MFKTITATEAQSLIDGQKQAALVGTVHVFADSQSLPQVSATVDRFSTLCDNPGLFVTHKLTSNPKAMISELASACPRVLLFAVINTSDSKSANWFRQSFPQHAAKVPFADIYVADIADIPDSDRLFWERIGVNSLPTILTFKCGHLIDAFVPELPKSGALAQLAEIDAKKRADIEKKKLVNVEEELRRGSDPGREEYLKRKAEADWKAAEKERREKEAEARRVKARIEEQRRARWGSKVSDLIVIGRSKR
jgi:hypothetical protein